jgi:hypothetical protein
MNVYLVERGLSLIQNDSNDSASSSQELCILCPFEPGIGNYQRLRALAERDHSSVEFLDRQAPHTFKFDGADWLARRH